MSISIFNFLRSLGLGGIIGVGLFALLLILFPQFFLTYFSVQQVVIFGGVLGVALHRWIDNIIIKGFFHPAGNFASYYWKLLQLEFQVNRGIMTIKTYERIKAKLDDDFFLSDLENKRKTSNNRVSNVFKEFLLNRGKVAQAKSRKRLSEDNE